MLNILDKKGYFKKFKYGELIPWVMSASFCKYCMAIETDCLGSAMRKFYLKASAMTTNDIILCEVWNKMKAAGKI